MSKKSVFLTPAAEAFLDDESSFSGRLNYTVEVAAAIVRELCPMLPEAQWMALVAALNGHVPNYQRGWRAVLESAWASVADSGQELDEAWGIDCAALALHMSALPVAQQWAALEVVRRYWASECEGSNVMIGLRAAGARIAGER